MLYTSSATPMRSFLLFGYLEDGLWVWLGTQDDPKHEITDPATFANERLTIATMYDSQPWDAKWLEPVLSPGHAVSSRKLASSE